MGNEHSQVSGIEIDQRAIEVSDFWTQHKAKINSMESESKLTIFASDLFLNEPFWSPQTPLEKFSKNIMLYRHPCIVRYISSWQKASKFYLAVEEITPLSHLIAHMTTMEICLGLYSILKALCFLHEKAAVSHNNLCLASIFVSKDGSWKLAGMEYLCTYKDLTVDFLKRSKSHRYNKGMDSNEEENIKKCGNQKDFIDVFSFCTLVVELLKNKTDADYPNLPSFRDFCVSITQEPNSLQRPRLISLLDHDFFKHKFIGIHSFLIELPLKSDAERNEFFIHLKDELKTLEEEIVACKLGRLLVSRMVLLNNEARKSLLPYLLIPRKGENGAIFSEETFKKYIAPKLLNIFGVRDAQIRLLLMEYFPHFLDCYTKEELQLFILPELLVGIKDTNNDLVAATLHTLADLVPVLGAEVVIGGKRAKLFNDGQPKTNITSKKSVSQTSRHNSIQKEEVSTSSVSSRLGATNSIINLISDQNLPERPRPDGEEGETSTDEVEISADEDVDNWDDWENENIADQTNDTENILASSVLEPVETLPLQIHLSKSSTNLVNAKPTKILGIEELDIKNQAKIELEQNEVDFFEDMVPVIETSNKFLIDKIKAPSDSVSSKLSANIEDVSEEGWGDDWE